jgi:hypothetical protein
MQVLIVLGLPIFILFNLQKFENMARPLHWQRYRKSTQFLMTVEEWLGL